jgi:hypothetical protein
MPTQNPSAQNDPSSIIDIEEKSLLQDTAVVKT